jgi:hypothetical protein
LENEDEHEPEEMKRERGESFAPEIFLTEVRKDAVRLNERQIHL